jgi:hypothetical protein
MYDLYLNIVSFIRFSGLDPEYKALEQREIADLINKNKPIEIKLGKYIIVIFHKTVKPPTYTALNARAEESPETNFIFIKNSWTKGKPDNAIYMTFDDFDKDIAPRNQHYDIKVYREGLVPESFEFFDIDPDGLPKIMTSNILAKWLLLKERDIISYTLFTEGGSMINYRQTLNNW